MAIHAFDKDGNKIPFAVFDTDYTVDDGAKEPVKDALGYTALIANPVDAVAVEVSVTNVNERGVFLTVKSYAGETLGFGLTAEEVFAHTNWIVCGTVHPLHGEIPEVAFREPRKPFNDLKAMDEALSALYAEEGGSNGERYKELSGGHGLVRLTACRRDVLRLIAQITMVSLTGMWPIELHRMGM